MRLESIAIRLEPLFLGGSPLFLLNTCAVKTVKFDPLSVCRFLCVGASGYLLAEERTRTGLADSRTVSRLHRPHEPTRKEEIGAILIRAMEREMGKGQVRKRGLKRYFKT